MLHTDTDFTAMLDFTRNADPAAAEHSSASFATAFGAGVWRYSSSRVVHSRAALAIARIRHEDGKNSPPVS
jgi:hypothetical protein